MEIKVDYDVYRNSQEELEELWNAAHIDSLTKLFNRYGMEKWITRFIDEKMEDDVCALLIIDVDNFKNVNDSFGHMLGDALLVDIADHIRQIFQDEYFLGRVGGDEYQIFAPKVLDKQDLLEKAGKLCEIIKNQYEKEHQNYGISLSIGIAFSNSSEKKYSEMYKEADIALYRAKSMGKNCYSVFEQGETEAEKVPNGRLKNAERKEFVEQLGESGFSVSKVMLDKVIDILQENYDPKEAIEKMARVIADTFDVTRAYASCYTKDRMHIGKSYFYSQVESENIAPHLAISADEYSKKCFNSDGIFFCTDIEQTVEPIRSELRRMGVQTLLQVFVYKDGQIIGTVGVNNCGYKRLWLQSEIETMHTIAKLLTDHIYRLQQECD